MSLNCKTTRRAPARHAKPFEPEFPLTSLRYESTDYDSQQLYAYWNHSLNGSFCGKTILLYEISGRDINKEALECDFQINGAFKSLSERPLCETRNDGSVNNDVEKKERQERKYFWNDHLLFLKRSSQDVNDRKIENEKCEDEVVALFQLCFCKSCKKKPGIPIKSLRPIRTELCFSVSEKPNNPTQFANVPVILKPAVLSLRHDEPPTSKLTKTGLISPEYLAYFTELPPNLNGKFPNVRSLSISQIAFEKMAVKLVQICEMEVMEWPAFEENKETQLRLRHRRNLAVDVITESSHSSRIAASDDDILIKSPPFTGLSTLEEPLSFTNALSSTSRKEGEGETSIDDEPLSQPPVIENLKSLAAATTDSVPVKRPSMCLRTMLEQEINTDWEIISTDGKAIKCHLAVLATQVPFFRSLASAGNQANLGSFAMPADTEMDEIAVKGFLRFIYFQDTEFMKRSFRTCFTLLRTGHWHQLSNLVKATADVIITQSHRLNHLEWFTVKGLWKLFAYVRSWEDEYPRRTELMIAAVNVLKILLPKTSKTNGLLKITNGNEVLADLIYGFLT